MHSRPPEEGELPHSPPSSSPEPSYSIGDWDSPPHLMGLSERECCYAITHDICHIPHPFHIVGPEGTITTKPMVPNTPAVPYRVNNEVVDISGND